MAAAVDSPATTASERGFSFSVPPLAEVAKIISNSDAPIEQRMKALFNARHYGGKEAVDALAGGINDKSVLLVHEIAYVMGQVGDSSAIPILTSMLQNLQMHSMVRHEAAEGLAAIGEESAIPIIKSFLQDPDGPVRETCELAYRSLQEKMQEKQADIVDSTTGRRLSEDSARVNFYLYNCTETFTTRDPIAKKNKQYKLLSTPALREILLNEKEDLYLRYEALFILRDRMTEEADEAIIAALDNDKSSALFRHELAFVLGQIQRSAAVESLGKCLSDLNEHPMARHEAALALGSLGTESTATEKCVKLLNEFSKDPDPIVYESCLVGLDNIREEAEQNKKFAAVHTDG